MRNKSAKIYYQEKLAGRLWEDEDGYHFLYDQNYLANNEPSVSLTLPLQKEEFKQKQLFSFFDGLIPEGWLLDIATTNWKLNPKDRFLLLLTLCKDCLGAVSVISEGK